MKLWFCVSATIMAASVIAGPVVASDRIPHAELTRVTGMPVYCYDGEIPLVTGDGWHMAGMWSPDGWIGLSGRTCKWLNLTLSDTYPVDRRLGWIAAAWHTLAHEYAHSLGYLHGEDGRPDADCIGERKERALMARAGLPRRYRILVQRFAVNGCHPPPRPVIEPWS